MAVGLVTLLWPEGCCCFKTFQDKTALLLLPDFQICESAVTLGVELELGEGEEDDVLEIKMCSQLCCGAAVGTQGL